MKMKKALLFSLLLFAALNSHGVVRADTFTLISTSMSMSGYIYANALSDEMFFKDGSWILKSAVPPDYYAGYELVPYTFPGIDESYSLSSSMEPISGGVAGQGLSADSSTTPTSVYASASNFYFMDVGYGTPEKPHGTYWKIYYGEGHASASVRTFFRPNFSGVGPALQVWLDFSSCGSRVSADIYDVTSHKVIWAWSFDEIHEDMIIHYADWQKDHIYLLAADASATDFCRCDAEAHAGFSINMHFSSVPEVPEPAAMLLLSFGLLGLAGLKRKMRI
jgi:hypothetical protein